MQGKMFIFTFFVSFNNDINFYVKEGAEGIIPVLEILKVCCMMTAIFYLMNKIIVMEIIESRRGRIQFLCLFLAENLMFGFSILIRMDYPTDNAILLASIILTGGCGYMAFNVFFATTMY